MQKFLKSFFKDILARPSLYFLLFFMLFSIDRHHRFECQEHPDNGPFYSDVFEYYSFLPEYFLNFKQVPEQNFSTSKRTVGMAIMYSPAFFVGHIIAKYSGAEDDGYSPPYHQAIRWGSIIYCLLGLFFCRKNLLFFFSEQIVTITLACIFFGTNLFFYTYSSGEFPHSYLFFLNSAFIYFTLQWVRNSKQSALLLLFFIGGMITLIRPTGILVFLFPLLYNVNSSDDLIGRIKLIFKNLSKFSLALIVFFLPLVFQAFIWKHYKGQFIIYSYGDEHFFFNDPQVYNFLLSFRKGWLIYTPIMIFALVGMILARKNLKALFSFLWIYFLLNIYILSSWWDWAYGGSFGCRVLIESYAFLAFPFALFINLVWNHATKFSWQKSGLRIVLLFIFYLFIYLNIFQTWQMKYGRIHYSGMNWETYKYVFLRHITTEEANALKSRYTSPDPEKMKRGERDL